MTEVTDVARTVLWATLDEHRRARRPVRAFVVALAVAGVVWTWAAGETAAAAKKKAASPPVATHGAANACGCYKDAAGGCLCGKKGKCGCPGDCEPRGCEEKRAKEMEREIKAETKRAQNAEKRHKSPAEKTKETDKAEKGDGGSKKGGKAHGKKGDGAGE